ncbi:M16 family metallopeptidase [Chloroflexota bacterium]
MHKLTTLDNGLRILTVTMPHVRSVSLGFFLGVGSRYENESLAGASHFIEHMTFKGTASRPTALEIAEAIEGKGGMFNATTGLETSLLWAKVSARHLPGALDVLSDMLLGAMFDPEEIEKVRAIISEEINCAHEGPDSLAQIIVNRLQWPNHPLGREVAGSQHSVAALDRQALLDYRANHYHPNETILGLAGQVDHQEVAAWARAHLMEWESGPPAGFEPAPENHHGPNLHVEYRDTEQAHLCFSFEGLSRSDPERYVLSLLNMLLGEGMRSRLFQEVRERLGLAYSVDSYASMLQDSGAVSIYAGVAPERAQEAIHAILGQLDRLRQEMVPEDELQKAREFVRGRLTLSLEDSLTLVSWYARQELFGPEVLEPDDVLARFEAVQATDMLRIAQTVFQPERLNLAMVGPFVDDGQQLDRAVQF